MVGGIPLAKGIVANDYFRFPSLLVARSSTHSDTDVTPTPYKTGRSAKLRWRRYGENVRRSICWRTVAGLLAGGGVASGGPDVNNRQV
jgi:hypothetical protein